MIKVSVLYPNTEGKRFDQDYYIRKHMPMVQQTIGAYLKGVSVEAGLGGAEPGSPPTYLMMGHLVFESLEVFQTAFGLHGQAIMSDIPNYTDIQPVIQISEVKL